MAYGFNQTGTLKVDKETASRERLASLKERGLTERAGIAARAIRKPAMKSVGDTRAEAPYLPERLEEGRLGDIMRASPKELQSIYEGLPEAERPVHLIRGTEESYFSPGTRQEYGDLRTAMTGFRQRPAETTAAARLSAAVQGQAREQALEDYDIKTTAMLSPYTIRGPKGEELIPGWARELYSTGRAMSLKDPGGAIRHVEGVLSERKRVQTESKGMDAADLMAAAGLAPTTGVPVETSGVAETAEVPGMPKVPRTRTGLSAAATRLQEQYESEHPISIIGAKTFRRVSEALTKRKKYPVESSLLHQGIR